MIFGILQFLQITKAWASAGGAKRAFPPWKLGLRTKIL